MALIKNTTLDTVKRRLILSASQPNERKGKMKIEIGKNKSAVEAHDIGYDVNGNRRHVVHYRSIFNEIAERTGIEYSALSPMDYATALDAMKRIGGKKYHNKKYGGGIAFTLDRSELSSAINEAIDVYCRWYNSEHVKPAIVMQAADNMRHRLPIVVKSTNCGYKISGEYSNGASLTVKVDYDHDMSLTENPLRAALLWAAKAEYKRWQLNGQDSRIKVLSEYTALDANTRVYMYEIEGF